MIINYYRDKPFVRQYIFHSLTSKRVSTFVVYVNQLMCKVFFFFFFLVE